MRAISRFLLITLGKRPKPLSFIATFWPLEPKTGKVLIRLSLAAQLHVNILFLENIVEVALSRSDTRRSATLRGRDPSQRGRGFCGRRSLDGSTRTLGRTAACAERAVPKAVSRRKRDQQVVQLFRRGVCKSDHGSLRRHA